MGKINSSCSFFIQIGIECIKKEVKYCSLNVIITYLKKREVLHFKDI